MNARPKIERMIQEKEKELEELREKERSIRAYVSALQDVLKILPRESAAAQPDGVIRQGSAVAQSRNLIRRFQRPMHVTELLEQMGKPSTKQARASLSGSLAAYVRREEIFTRPAPNTFGLIELGHHDAAETSDDAAESSDGETILEDGPPSDFGHDRPVQHQGHSSDLNQS